MKQFDKGTLLAFLAVNYKDDPAALAMASAAVEFGTAHYENDKLLEYLDSTIGETLDISEELKSRFFYEPSPQRLLFDSYCRERTVPAIGFEMSIEEENGGVHEGYTCLTLDSVPELEGTDLEGEAGWVVCFDDVLKEALVQNDTVSAKKAAPPKTCIRDGAAEDVYDLASKMDFMKISDRFLATVHYYWDDLDMDQMIQIQLNQKIIREYGMS